MREATIKYGIYPKDKPNKKTDYVYVIYEDGACEEAVSDLAAGDVWTYKPLESFVLASRSLDDLTDGEINQMYAKIQEKPPEPTREEKIAFIKSKQGK